MVVLLAASSDLLLTERSEDFEVILEAPVLLDVSEASKDSHVQRLFRFY
jgi:hypothetical protein